MNKAGVKRLGYLSMLVVLLSALFLMIPFSYSETETTFNDSTSLQNFSGNGQWSNTTYVRLPETALISSATVVVTTYNFSEGSETFPSNVSIDVGDDGNVEFNNSRVEATIMLQEPDTENLEDTDGYVGNTFDGGDSATISAGEQIDPTVQQVYIKFFSAQTFGNIIKGDFFIRAYDGNGASRYNSGNTFDLYEISNHTWDENSCRGHLTLFPCPDYQDLIASNDVTEFLSGANQDDWVNFTVTDWLIENFITNGRKNISFLLNFSYAPGADSRIDFRSKEYNTDTSHRPFLNITAAVNATFESSATLNITNSINSYLASCTPVNGFCDVPIAVAGSDGRVVLSSLNITYADSPKIEFTERTLANNSRTSNNYIFTEVNIQDVNISNVTFELFNSSLDLITNHTNASNVGYSTNYSVNWTNIADGNYSYNATIIDAEGLINHTETRFLILDATIPQILFAGGNAANNTFVNRDWIFVNVSVTEENFANITYYLYNSAFQLINETNFTTQTFQLNFTNLADTDETYYYNVTVRDFVGNINSTGTLVLNLDSVLSGIRLDSPLNNSWTNSPVTFAYTPTDSSLDTCILYHNQTTWMANESNGSVSSGVQDIITLSLPDGYFVWDVFCNDTTGNQLFNGTNFTINVDSTNPTIDFDSGTLANNSFVDQNWIFVNLTANDTNEANVTFYLYNSSLDLVNQTTLSAGGRQINFTNLADTNEIYYYNATIVDNASNENSTNTRRITLDSIVPQIVLDTGSAPNNSIASRDWIFVNISVTETNVANITFYLYDSSLSLVNQTNITSSIFRLNFTNLADTNEIYRYNVTIVDQAGHENSTQTRIITLDTLNPSVSFSTGTSPNNTFADRNWIFINVSSSDTNADNMTINVFDSTRTLVNQTNFTAFTDSNASINITNLADRDELYYYNVSVVDQAGNQNFTETRLITLDSIAPSINLTYPVNGTTYDFFQTILNYTVSDANLNSCWYTLDNGTTNTTISCSQNVTGLSSGDGNFTWTVYVNDSAEHLNSSTVMFTVVLEAPNVTLSYPSNNTFFNNGTNIYMNYTGIDNNSLARCTLFHDFNGTWQANESDSSVASGVEDSFVFNNTIDGVKTWNVLCNDTTGTSSFATSNFSFVYDTSVPVVDDINVTTTSGSKSVSFVASYDELTCNDTFFTVYMSNGSVENNLSNVSTTCANFNDTFSVTSFGTYNITVFVRDFFGLENSSSTQFTTAAASSGGSGSSGGGGGGGGSGGGGGGGAPSGPTYSKAQFFSLVEAGKQVSISLGNENIAFTRVRFTPIVEKEGISVSIRNIKEKPDVITNLPSGEIYQWLEIDLDKITTDELGSVVIDFKVSVDWIEAESIDYTTVQLVRYITNEEYEHLSTRHLRNNGSHRFYNAVSDGFSYFVIVANKTKDLPSEIVEEVSLPEIEGAGIEPIIEQPTLLDEVEDATPGVVSQFLGGVSYKFYWQIFIIILAVGLLLNYTVVGGIAGTKYLHLQYSKHRPKKKEHKHVHQEKKQHHHEEKEKKAVAKPSALKVKFKWSFAAIFKRKTKNAVEEIQRKIKPGVVYIYDRKGKKSSYEIFAKLTESHPGIAVVRENPNTFGNKNKNVQHIWLSTTRASNAINPSDIEDVLEQLDSFSKNTKTGIIFIEGISHLIRGTNFSTVMHVLTLLKDRISATKHSMIISYNSTTFDEEHLTKLKSEFEQLNGGN